LSVYRRKGHTKASKKSQTFKLCGGALRRNGTATPSDGVKGCFLTGRIGKRERGEKGRKQGKASHTRLPVTYAGSGYALGKTPEIARRRSERRIT